MTVNNKNSNTIPKPYSTTSELLSISVTLWVSWLHWCTTNQTRALLLVGSINI